MDGIMDENQVTVAKEYDFKKPLVHKIDSIFDKCYRDGHNKYFHTFEFKCVYNIELTNTGNNEIVDLEISDKSMGLHELN